MPIPPTSMPTANTSAMRRSLNTRISLFPASRRRREAAVNAASRIGQESFRSRTRSAALLGDLVVVAALEGNPVGFQVLRTRQVVGPGIARDQALGLPHDVKLAVAFDFADEHRLGD